MSYEEDDGVSFWVYLAFLQFSGPRNTNPYLMLVHFLGILSLLVKSGTSLMILLENPSQVMV